MTVTRTIEINDLTPKEMAEIFASYLAEEQAEFFNSLWELGKDWPGAGWCQQSCSIVTLVNSDCISWLDTFFAHAVDRLPVAARTASVEE